MNWTHRTLALLAMLQVAACSPSVGQSSATLEPLEPADDPYPGVTGERCNLATFDEGESFIHLVAFQDAAVARVDGAPVRLTYQGGNMRGGGTFRAEGIAVEIGGISAEMAEAAQRAGVPAVVAVRQGDSVENFEGVWTCGLMRPEPAPTSTS